MICVCTGETSLPRILRAIKGQELAEVRIDLARLDDQAIDRVFSSRERLIATCRPGCFDEVERKRKLLRAILAGAACVDVEIESDAGFRREVIKCAREHACEVIVSYHNFETTPSAARLQRIIKECFSKKADIAKVACQVNSSRDVATLLGLLDGGKRLVVIGMGDKGIPVRVLAPLLGAEFTMASARGGKGTAPGQIGADKLQKMMEAACRLLSLQ